MAAADGSRAREHAARVLHISSRRIVPPLLSDDASFDQRFRWLAGEAADQLAQALAQPRRDAPLVLICSTTLSKMASGWPDNAQALFDIIQARCGHRPAGLLEAYQCAGWGYALRFAAVQTRCRWLVLSIVDSDLHEMVTTGYEEAIGRIGFGVSTVALDLDGITELPLCKGPAPNHGFTDLLHALRNEQRRTGPGPIFMPFLPAGLAEVSRRMLGDSLGPNRHDHYGHTFGSDPWIGLAEWLRDTRPATEQRVTLGAFAYDGYYTAGAVTAGPGTRLDLRADALPQDAGVRA